MTEGKRKGPQDGEKQRPGGLRRFLIFLLVLVSVLGVVMAAAYRDGTGFDVLRRSLSYRGKTSGGQTVYKYDAGARNRFANLDGALVILSDTHLQVLSEEGEEVWSTTVNMKAPALHQSGNRAVAYDVGGTELYVVGPAGELMHQSVKETEPLLSARLNEDGWLAVTAEKQTYKGCVTVYNQGLEAVFAFNSSDRFVTDACVGRGGRYLAAVTLGQETGVFVSSVVLYNMEEEQPMASYDIADGLVAAIAEHNGRLVTVSDTCLTLAELGGTVAATYFYSDVYLRGYTLGGEEFLALLLNRYQSGSVGQLVTLDRNGAVLGSLEVSQEVLGLSAAGRYLAVLYADRLVIYNQDLQVYASLNGTDFASGVLMRPDGSALLLSASSARLFLP